MERRAAFATAGAITATVMAAAVALGANMGLFGLANADDGPGSAHLVESKATVNDTRIVDVPVPASQSAPTPSTAAAPRSQSQGGSSVQPSTTHPTVDDDDSYEDDEYESEPEDDDD